MLIDFFQRRRLSFERSVVFDKNTNKKTKTNTKTQSSVTDDPPEIVKANKRRIVKAKKRGVDTCNTEESADSSGECLF